MNRSLLPLYNQRSFSFYQASNPTQFDLYQNFDYIQKLDLGEPIEELNIDGEKVDTSIEVKGRNSRKPKKSNHGARPCSSYMRKLKLRGHYRKLRVD